MALGAAPASAWHARVDGGWLGGGDIMVGAWTGATLPRLGHKMPQYAPPAGKKMAICRCMCAVVEYPQLFWVGCMTKLAQLGCAQTYFCYRSDVKKQVDFLVPPLNYVHPLYGMLSRKWQTERLFN